MKIAVFGGTGRTGKHFIEKALTAGHQVSVLARTPSKLERQHSGLTVQQGDAVDLAAVNLVIAGTDAVVSLLGPTKGQQPFTVSHAIGNILTAMQQNGVRRLVLSAGAGVGDPNDQPTFISRLFDFLLKISARAVYEDMLQVVKTVRDSNLDWTIARAPMLYNGPYSGQVRADYLGGDVGSRLSRANLAAFILEQVESDEYLHRAPVISD